MTPVTERRKFTRFPARQRVKVWVPGDDFSTELLLSDLSSGGAGFEAQEGLQVASGDTVLLNIDERLVETTVVKADSDRFGVRFTEHFLPESRIARLLHKTEEPPRGESREMQERIEGRPMGPMHDPEILSLLLHALAAAGNIASLLSHSGGIRRRWEQEEMADREAVRQIVIRTERALSDLRANVKSLELLFESSERRHLGPTVAFGSVQLFLNSRQRREWHQIQQDVLDSAAELQDRVFDLTAHFACGERKLPASFVDHLKEAIKELNTLLFHLQDEGYSKLFGKLERVILGCVDATRELRIILGDMYGPI